MIENVHERRVAASADRVGELLETWGSDHDKIWRTDVSEPTFLDRGLEVGSRGGHGPVRYAVTHHEPGRRVDLGFEPGLGLRGRHSFIITPQGEQACVVRHELIAATERSATVLRPLIEALHDATVEDVFDHIERELTGRAHRAQPTAPFLRWLGRTLRSRGVERCDACLELPVAEFGTVHAADCFTTVVLPGDPVEPRAWAEGVLGRSPAWINLLMRLRDTAVRPLGLQTAGAVRPPTGFPVLADHGDEILMGLDDRHLDFRVRVAVRDRAVHLTATVHINSHIGRLYWAVVRHVHPRVVRSMLAGMAFPPMANQVEVNTATAPV